MGKRKRGKVREEPSSDWTIIGRFVQEESDKGYGEAKKKQEARLVGRDTWQ
jgi:hypothetical protein